MTGGNMHKNAGIKDEKEAINRLLMDEEVFYYQDKPIKYNLHRGVVPFTYDGDPLDNETLSCYGDWEVRDWTVNLPMLCKVWDEEDLVGIAVVTRFDEWTYFTSCDKYYSYAKPLAKKEIQVFLDKAPE